MEDRERTQVGIVGAGPAGLVLGHLLARRGIDSVILESRSRDYVEGRVRAGVLEQGTVDLLVAEGVGERLLSEGILHRGTELRFGGHGRRIDFERLAGGGNITIYGQQEVVKDLIAARIGAGHPLRFEAEVSAIEGFDGDRPTITYTHDGFERLLECDFVLGADGFHGVARAVVPEDRLTVYEREYPFAWLGILAEVAPSTDELIYAYHERGFALHSLRSPELSRLYVQCDPDDDIEEWPDERIWDELDLRLTRDDGWRLERGPIIEKGIAPLRSFVAEPMRFGRLFLAGDAVHIVPPTGAKGLNLAVADVKVLAAALADHFERGDDSGLDAYSETCLRRIWRAQHFAAWMTEMLHRYPDSGDAAGDRYRARLQLAQLEYVTSSDHAGGWLAENYVGTAPMFDPAGGEQPLPGPGERVAG